MKLTKLLVVSYNYRIITNTRATGFSNFYRNSQQKADSVHLEQGEDYLLVAELKEGGGGDYLQVISFFINS